MIVLLICVILVVIAVILYSIKNKTNINTECKSASGKIDSVEQNTDNESQKYSMPGKIEKPISTKRTLIDTMSQQGDCVSIQLNTYSIKERFRDVLPFQYKQSHTYKIKGKNLATNRQKTFTIVAFDEEDLKKRAFAKGLIEPFEITVCDVPPSDKQKDFLRDLGMTIKSEYSSEDASCIISRTYEHEPAAEEWLLTFAMGRNIPFSLYATSGNVIYHICKDYFTDIIHEIAFWVFTVNHHASGDTIFYENRFVSVAKVLNKDNDFMRLYEKTNIDYMRPNSRTIIYKKVIEALNEK